MKNITDIYVRLSDEDREKRCAADESESIQNQKSMLINYCLEQGWQINGIYCDEDYSGADRNRPAFNQMLKDCEEGKVDIVLCKTQSRFSRDMEVIEKYIHGKFLEWNVRFVSIVDHADTNVAGNKKARQINGLINEWYLEDLSDNIKRTLDHKKKRGEYCSPFAPYGYKIDPDNKNHFVIDPPAAEVVKRIFEMYKSGMGYIRIAKTLNEEKIPSPYLHKAMNGSGYKNTNAGHTAMLQWKDSSIYYILRHEAYIGSIVQGKSRSVSYKNKKRVRLPKEDWIIIPNMHEPIISNELWNSVQDIINSNKGRDKLFKTGGAQEINPLRGIVYCMECGSSMWRMSYSSGQRRYKYFRCRTVKNSAGKCANTSSIRQTDLEEAIIRELNNILAENYDKDSINLSREDNTEKRIKNLVSERELLDKSVSKVQKNTVRLYKDKLDGLINDVQFKMISDELNAENEQYAKRKELIDNDILKISESQRSKLSREEVLSKYENVEKADFKLINEMIEKVYVGKVEDTGCRTIEIHWKF